MTTPALPTDGQVNWGDPLNTYIANVVMATLNTQVANLSSHEANSPTDPHGDRAYALNLMLPITQNVNLPGGFVQLTGAGFLPSSVTPTPDSWHDLRPYSTAFVAASGRIPPQYRKADGGVRLAGYIATTATAYNGSLAFANVLPTGIWPTDPVDLPVTVPGYGTGLMTISASGNVTLSELPASVPAGTPVGLFGWYPLAASYTLITS